MYLCYVFYVVTYLQMCKVEQLGVRKLLDFVLRIKNFEFHYRILQVKPNKDLQKVVVFCIGTNKD